MKNLVACLFLFAALLLARFTARAQGVGIGTLTPDTKAALDVRATDKGLLIPRLTAAQRTGITAPPQGLLVYQTDGSAGGGAGTGFWYFAGSPAAWVFLNPAGGGGADNLGNGIATTPVNLQANALVGTGASIGAAVGLGVRADGGLNLGQNTAGRNVFVGYQAGQATTTGDYNQFDGYQSGASNTTGYFNQFSGYGSGTNNTTGFENQFSGYQSGSGNTTGFRNQFNGYQSGFANTTGIRNLFTGYLSGQANTTGSFNQFVGVQAGLRNTAGDNNQFSGYQSGFSNTTGERNHFSGYQSGFANTLGTDNHFSGYQAGQGNTTGSYNYFSGHRAGYRNTTGIGNQFSGYLSGYDNTTGSDNQFSGYLSGYANTTGSFNQFSGFQSGDRNTTGTRNWAFGYQSGPTTNNLTNAGALGANARVSQSNSLVLGGVGGNAVRVGIGTPAPAARLHVYGSGPTILRVQSSDAFGTAGLDFWSDPQGSQSEWRPVALRSADAGNFTGQLVFYTNGTGYANRQAGVEQMRLVNGGLAIGTTAVGNFRLNVAGIVNASGGYLTASDQRLKTHVRPLTGALALVQALHGRRYQWNALGVARGGTAGQEQVGLLAQELARVLPELVSTGPDGYQAVNYAQLAPVLVEAIKELKAENDALRQQRRQDRAAAEAQAAGFAQRLRALEAAGAQAAAGPR